MEEEKNNEKITTIPELVGFIKNSFQTAQEHVDERFTKVEGDISSIKEDVALMKTYIALTKVDVLEIKKDISELKENFNVVANKEDKLAKQESDTNQEDTMTALKLKRHDNWFQQIANKLGIKLEY